MLCVSLCCRSGFHLIIASSTVPLCIYVRDDEESSIVRKAANLLKSGVRELCTSADPETALILLYVS